MGLGRRTFAPGEVLTASNVMNYLMDQSVMNFAGTAARGSALGTAASEGMVSYLNDTDSLEVYRTIGTAAPEWNQVAFESYVDNKPVSGLVPIIPPTVSISGGTATANTLGLISFTTATSVSLENVFTSDYKNYKILVEISASSATTSAGLRVRTGGADVTTTTYARARFDCRADGTSAISGSTTSTGAFHADVHVSSNIGSIGVIDVFSPALPVRTRFSTNASGASSGGVYSTFTATHSQSGATSYESISLIVGTGNITGTIQVYGYND